MRLPMGNDRGVKYDVVVVGSGFGGSVAALRAAEPTPARQPERPVMTT